MLSKKNFPRHRSRLCAALLLAFELGGQAAEVLSQYSDAQQAIQAVVGAPFTFNTNADGRHAVWDCGAVIDLAVNLRLVPGAQRQSILQDIQRAVDDINGSTSFSFRLVGLTDVIPTSSLGVDWIGHEPKAPVVIGFGDSSDTDLFTPGAAAVGGQFVNTDPNGFIRARAGWVYVHIDHLGDYTPGRGHLGRVGLFAHELLHVLGLGHVDSHQSGSLMTPRLSDSSGYLGAGDIAGLRQLEAVSCSRDSP